MADETTTAIEQATDTAEATVNTAADVAEKEASAAKTATKRTARTAKRAAKTVAEETKKTARRTKAKRRVRRAKPEVAAPSTQERIEDMNFDVKNWFANFGAPTNPLQTMFAEAGERGQDIVRRGQKASEEVAEMTRSNVEALVEAGRITVEGVRSIGQDVVESGREGVEQAADAVRSLAEAKSPTEFIQLQTELARSSFDRIVSESSRLTETMVKLAGDAIQPISSRASLNAERLNKFVA